MGRRPAPRLSRTWVHRTDTEVLRLHHLGLTQRQIAQACSIGQSTVSEYLKAAEAAQLRYPEVADWDEVRLTAALVPTQAPPKTARLPEPDFASIHHELQGDKHVTLMLLWQEYKENNPEGYNYSRFCELYRRWHRKLEVVLRQDHRAGEKLFVDYAGDPITVRDPESGQVLEAQLFVAVLGASNYTYAEATWTQGLGDWIGAHIRALDFFGGAPEILVPDYVPGHIIRLMCPIGLCGRQPRRTLREQGITGRVAT